MAVYGTSSGPFLGASYSLWKLARSTGKAAWIAGTTFVILFVPLIIELEREAQLVEFETSQLDIMAEAARPVLHLFRIILRAHREKLPAPMRELGDTYVKDEFRKHLRGKTTQEQWRQFMEEWRRYAGTLAASDGPQASGGVAAADASGDIPPEVLETLTPDQRARLAKLRAEAQRLRADLLGESR
ncbi:Mitochondrial import receptor subunit TOM9-2 [Auxenochlorella protothecoides]|uniref:Succinate dehydrogenase assembly factor 3 n=1 Tax=Auxenochlorella protothecoides TaxID=3075 RepID=A0A087SHG5_AUXPR|nr:Mitochondrial import receptor subunit TOM9-2 [Auxenochlorella protothecoides]KFM25169.1 Mitochondrial import receptor subunit TOM9-2 [Auxenochlorella protothecoides]